MKFITVLLVMAVVTVELHCSRKHSLRNRKFKEPIEEKQDRSEPSSYEHEEVIEVEEQAEDLSPVDSHDCDQSPSKAFQRDTITEDAEGTSCGVQGEAKHDVYVENIPNMPCHSFGDSYEHDLDVPHDPYCESHISIPVSHHASVSPVELAPLNVGFPHLVNPEDDEIEDIETKINIDENIPGGGLPSCQSCQTKGTEEGKTSQVAAATAAAAKAEAEKEAAVKEANKAGTDKTAADTAATRATSDRKTADSEAATAAKRKLAADRDAQDAATAVTTARAKATSSASEAKKLIDTGKGAAVRAAQMAVKDREDEDKAVQKKTKCELEAEKKAAAKITADTKAAEAAKAEKLALSVAKDAAAWKTTCDAKLKFATANASAKTSASEAALKHKTAASVSFNVKVGFNRESERTLEVAKTFAKEEAGPIEKPSEEAAQKTQINAAANETNKMQEAKKESNEMQEALEKANKIQEATEDAQKTKTEKAKKEQAPASEETKKTKAEKTKKIPSSEEARPVEKKIEKDGKKNETSLEKEGDKVQVTSVWEAKKAQAAAGEGTKKAQPDEDKKTKTTDEAGPADKNVEEDVNKETLSMATAEGTQKDAGKLTANKTKDDILHQQS